MSTHNICFYLKNKKIIMWLVGCAEVLRPSQPNGVMSSVVS